MFLYRKMEATLRQNLYVRINIVLNNNCDANYKKRLFSDSRMKNFSSEYISLSSFGIRIS